MFKRVEFFALLTGAALVWASCSAPPSGSKRPGERAFTLFVTADLRGTIEPCGCNSDPLGDMARTVELVTSVRQSGRAVLVVDGGSLLYSEPHLPEHLRAQETLKAELIYTIYKDTLRAAGIGLGSYDLGEGASGVKPPRQAVNVAAQSGVPLEPPKVVDAGGVKVGIFGVVAPSAVAGQGIEAGDPVAAAAAAVQSLRGQGAELVIGLAYMTHAEAARLARAAPGIDILVAGQNAPEPPEVKVAPTQVGSTFVVTPANRGQVVTKLDITMRNGGPLVDAIGEARASVELQSLGERIAGLTSDLAGWKADAKADPGFVAAKEAELVELTKRRDALAASPLQVPATGSFFTMEQIKIKRSLACNVEVQAAKQAFDKAAGEANVAAAQGKAPPAPAEGKAGYVGVEACAECHEEAVVFWKKTKHSEAWDTLEKVGKQYDYSCISCHVTGWDKPGGSNLAHNEPLRAVQCETCHGPGSLHVASEGDTEQIARKPAESLCITCHNSEHSDTFRYEAYLRDVTGPDHGAELREALGSGVTGHELRSAALEKAGKSLGAGCIK